MYMNFAFDSRKCALAVKFPIEPLTYERFSEARTRVIALNVLPSWPDKMLWVMGTLPGVSLAEFNLTHSF